MTESPSALTMLLSRHTKRREFIAVLANCLRAIHRSGPRWLREAPKEACFWPCGPFQHIGNRCSFVGELPAGPAVVLPINGSVDAVGGQAS
jgi:hypothetical protein